MSEQVINKVIYDRYFVLVLFFVAASFFFFFFLSFPFSKHAHYGLTVHYVKWPPQFKNDRNSEEGT